MIDSMICLFHQETGGTGSGNTAEGSGFKNNRRCHHEGYQEDRRNPGRVQTSV